MARLFKERLNTEFPRDDYVRQFTIRVDENLAKLDRVEQEFKLKVPDAPDIIFTTFNTARNRFKEAAEKSGKYISPFDLLEK